MRALRVAKQTKEMEEEKVARRSGLVQCKQTQRRACRLQCKIIDKDTAREIAELFKQDAFFWFDGQHFWIEPACVRDIAAARV